MELLYRLFLLAYPRRFRVRFGVVMLEMFRVQRRRAGRDPRPFARLRFWLFALDDLARNAAAERSAPWRHAPDPLVVPIGSRSALPLDRIDMLQTLLTELRHAVRRLAHAPVFTLTAIAITALGIGANSAIFSFVDATLLRPPAYERPHEVVHVYQDSDEGVPSSSSFPAYRDISAYDTIFSATMAILPFGATLVHDDGVEPLATEWVTSSYFSFLGLQPTIGRDFAPGDDLDSSPAVAIISHAWWQERYGGDPSVLGRQIRVNGAPVTIVGVGPAGYGGIVPGFSLDAWLSLSAVRPAMGDYPGDTFDNRGDHWFQIRARLSPGVSVAQAQAAMDQLAARLGREFPEYNEGRGITVFAADDVRIHPSVDGQLFPLSAGLMAIVGLILLIACANLANLLLVRSNARARDVSLRMALGASRGRVVWHVLAESLALSLAGGIVGLAIALWAIRLFAAVDLPTQLPGPLDLQLDVRVFAFTVGLSLATGILFGLLPGWRISRCDVVAGLHDESGVLTMRSGRFNLRNLLVVSQVAVSFLILMIAGLFVRSLGNTQRVPLDFHGDRLAVMSTNAGFAGYTSAEAAPLFDTVLERVQALPGVETAALTAQLPVRGGGGSSTLVIEDYVSETGTDAVEVLRSLVGPGYFETVGIPLLHGRSFTRDDVTSNAAVAIVSEAMATAYWERSNVVGARFRGQGSQNWIEIIGVVADVPVRALIEPPTPHFYYAFGGGTAATVIARTVGDPATALQPMRTVLRDVDPLLSVGRLQTFDEHVSAGLAGPRLGARLLSGFGLLGLALASLGLYAVVAFAVERRTTEVGIRMALGAARASVVGLVIREVMALVGVALAVGIAITWLAAPGVAANLYDVSATDPLTLAGAAALLVATGALAAWLPARRAARVDPVQALRHR